MHLIQVTYLILNLFLIINGYFTNHSNTRWKRQSSSNVCILPVQLENGKWSVFGNKNYNPGDQVPSGTILTFACNSNYKLYPNSNLPFVVCSNGIWSNLGHCRKTCPTIKSSTTVTATCELNGGKTSCERPYVGTRMFFQCSLFYENPFLKRLPYRYCHDGSWDFPAPTCEAVCGLKSVDLQQLVVNGSSATKGAFPWHIGLYYANNREYLCGGSIISPKMSLTAAHCFNSLEPKDYLISAGKYYRKYDDPRDIDKQYNKILRLIIHHDYKGGAPFGAFDIAILIHEAPFKLTKSVLPVCLDSEKQFNYANLIYKKGIIIGWGYTQVNSALSEELKMLEVDYQIDDTCRLTSDYSTQYKPYAPDKLCAGLLRQGKSACVGDSGGGLVFPGDANRYYIRGIVSLAPRKGQGCDSNQFTLFSSISYHIDFILKIYSKYSTLDINECLVATRLANGKYECDDLLECIPSELRCNGIPDCINGKDELGCKTIPEETTTQAVIQATITTTSSPITNDCILPAQLENGKWSLFGNMNLNPGDQVTPGTVLTFACNSNYKLYPNENQTFAICTNGWSNLAQCRKTCSTMKSSTTMIVDCELDGVKTSCERPYDGTRAFLKCAEFYEDANLKQRPHRFCKDGNWDSPVPICKPVCGLKSVEAQKLVINGTSTKKGEYPWHIGLYRASDRRYLCGGSIISPKMSLTAAICAFVLDPNYYLIAAGKYYREYDDPRDVDKQYNNISRVIVHPKWNRWILDSSDLAILIHEKPFKLTKWVLPVCLDTDKLYDNSNLINKKGIITVWNYTLKNSLRSEEFKMLEVDYRTEETCKLPDDFKEYMSNLLCVQWTGMRKNICAWNRGCGLFFPGDADRYYIRGIIGAFIDCEANEYILCTSISYRSNYEFILKIKDQYNA